MADMGIPDATIEEKNSSKKSSFAGDVLKLVSGTTFAQALTVLVSPILTRLYNPDGFGLLTLFVSISGILTDVSCGRYELSIPLPKSDEEAANMMAVSLGFATLTSLLTALVVWLVGPSIMRFLRAPGLRPFLWTIPVIVFFGGTSVGHPALNYWSQRTRQFGRLAMTRVNSSVIAVISQLVAGFTHFLAEGGLIFGSLVGSVISTSILGAWVWEDDHPLFRWSIRWRLMWAGIKRYRKFPIFTIWMSLLNNISWQLPAFLLSYYFSPTIVGYYGLGSRTLQLPMSLIGGSIAQAYYPRIVEAVKGGNLAKVVESAYERLVHFGLFPLLTLSIMGRDLFVLVFGQTWAEAGVYTQILSLWTFFWFISSPLGNLYFALEKQEFLLKLNIVIFITRLLSLVIGGYLHNTYLALILFAISGVVTYGYLSLAIINLAGVSWRRALQTIGIDFLRFVPVGAILILLKVVNAIPLVIVSVACLSGGIYYLWLVIKDPQLLGKLSRSSWIRKMGLKSPLLASILAHLDADEKRKPL